MSEEKNWRNNPEPKIDSMLGHVVHWTGYLRDPEPTDAIRARGKCVTVCGDAQWEIGDEITLPKLTPRGFGVWSKALALRDGRRVALDVSGGDKWLAVDAWAAVASNDEFDRAISKFGFDEHESDEAPIPDSTPRPVAIREWRRWDLADAEYDQDVMVVRKIEGSFFNPTLLEIADLFLRDAKDLAMLYAEHCLAIVRDGKPVFACMGIKPDSVKDPDGVDD